MKLCVYRLATYSKLTVGGSSAISFNLGHTKESNSKAGKTWVTKPSSWASFEEIFFPNKSNSEAFSEPIKRGKVKDEQPSGQRPN